MYVLLIVKDFSCFLSFKNWGLIGSLSFLTCKLCDIVLSSPNALIPHMWTLFVVLRKKWLMPVDFFPLSTSSSGLWKSCFRCLSYLYYYCKKEKLQDYYPQAWLTAFKNRLIWRNALEWFYVLSMGLLWSFLITYLLRGQIYEADT